MIEFKGTQGKWSIGRNSGNSGGYFEIYADPQDLSRDHINVICKIPDYNYSLKTEGGYYSQDSSNQHFNSQLLLSAPELLRALIDMVNSPQDETVLNNARIIIQQAQGEAIKLKPLAEKPLSSQLWLLTGEYWTDEHFSGPNNYIITEISTGRTFMLASEEEEKEFLKIKHLRDAQELIEKSNKYNNHPTAIIDYNNTERWKEALKILSDNPNKAVEMCEEAYYHFLENVPPVVMQGSAYVSGEPTRHNEKDEPVYLCGIQIKDKYYAQLGTEAQFNSRSLFTDFYALMNKEQLTRHIYANSETFGLWSNAAEEALKSDRVDLFIDHLKDQYQDEGSRPMMVKMFGDLIDNLITLILKS